MTNAERVAARVADMRAARDEHARAVIAGLVDYEVPAEVLAQHPGFAPLDPSTWPEPDRCTEGRPWGLDAYGTPWGSPADRWHAWLTGRGGRPCHNRWRDEGTRLCGTHLNAYRRMVDDAARRLRRSRQLGIARQQAARLAGYGVAADAREGGLLLDADAGAALVTVLDGDRDALLDLLAAVDRALPGRSAVNLGHVDTLADARDRARRHLDRTTHATPTTEQEQ